MPVDLKCLFSISVNKGKDEVLEGFPDTKTGDTKPMPYTNTNGKNVYGKQTGIKKAMKGDSGSASRFFYCAKASKSERDEGLNTFQEKRKCNSYTESREGMYKDRNTLQRNTHPTVKPIKLMQYLVRLVTPKDGTCLDPFLGSGSTGIACKKEGFNFVGIEKEEEYFDIAENRIKNTAVQDSLSFT